MPFDSPHSKCRTANLWFNWFYLARLRYWQITLLKVTASMNENSNRQSICTLNSSPGMKTCSWILCWYTFCPRIQHPTHWCILFRYKKSVFIIVRDWLFSNLIFFYFLLFYIPSCHHLCVTLQKNVVVVEWCLKNIHK